MEDFRKNALDILLGHMHKIFFSNFTLNHMMSFSRERKASCLSPGLPLRRKWELCRNKTIILQKRPFQYWKEKRFSWLILAEELAFSLNLCNALVFRIDLQQRIHSPRDSLQLTNNFGEPGERKSFLTLQLVNRVTMSKSYSSMAWAPFGWTARFLIAISTDSCKDSDNAMRPNSASSPDITICSSQKSACSVFSTT